MTERMAASKADAYIQIKQNIDRLTKEAEAIETELREHVAATGITDLGNLTAHTRATPPKLVLAEGAKGKLDEAIKALQADTAAADFLRLTLSVSDLSKAAEKPAIRTLLRRYKLSIASEDRIYFKAKP